VKLDRLGEEIAIRRMLAARYHRSLHDVAELELPPGPTEGGTHFDTYQNYEIEADDRDGLQRYLGERGVETIRQWGGKGVHELEGLGLACSLPRTERILRRSLMLPMNASLDEVEVDYVCDQVRSFYASVRAPASP
jgi:dTDP-4-amino-4,6-dideoxygalactose transaminase